MTSRWAQNLLWWANSRALLKVRVLKPSLTWRSWLRCSSVTTPARLSVDLARNPESELKSTTETTMPLWFLPICSQLRHYSSDRGCTPDHIWKSAPWLGPCHVCRNRSPSVFSTAIDTLRTCRVPFQPPCSQRGGGR